LASFHQGTWPVFIEALGGFSSRHLTVDEYTFSKDFFAETKEFRKIIVPFCQFFVFLPFRRSEFESNCRTQFATMTRQWFDN
jgi:hypothetical protein